MTFRIDLCKPIKCKIKQPRLIKCKIKQVINYQILIIHYSRHKRATLVNSIQKVIGFDNGISTRVNF